jgi:hypothetical protein
MVPAATYLPAEVRARGLICLSAARSKSRAGFGTGPGSGLGEYSGLCHGSSGS